MTLRENFSVVPQRSRRLSPDGAAGKSGSGAEGYLAMLRRVGLDTKLDILASQLSFGESRIVELIRLAWRSPSVVLLDEPLAGLSPTRRGDAMRLIETMKDSGAPVVIVEHYPQELMHLVDRMLVISKGRIAADEHVRIP